LLFCNDSFTLIYIKLQKETSQTMRYTTDNQGRLNNYAAEPAMYYAEYPSPEQQQHYALQGAIATLVVGLLILTSFAVS
jgi:hypothetical protein